MMIKCSREKQKREERLEVLHERELQLKTVWFEKDPGRQRARGKGGRKQHTWILREEHFKHKK